MESNTLLPYVLEALTRKPELSDTIINLCTEIESQLLYEHNNKYGDIQYAVQRALKVGEGLGIIAVTDNIARVPFSFRDRRNKDWRNAEDFDSLINQKTALAGEAHYRFNTHKQNEGTKNRTKEVKTSASVKNKGKHLSSSRMKRKRKEGEWEGERKNIKQEVQDPDEIDTRSPENIIPRPKTKRYGTVRRRIRKTRNSGRKRPPYRPRKSS